jgi:AcrR family transcriptional regulator
MHTAKPRAGRRLEPHMRREQLLDTGAAMFAEMHYDDVQVEDIAARAGVSRALFYHYYESKRDIYVAMFQRASTRFLARIRFDPELPLTQYLTVVVDAHIQSFIDHRFEAVTINRGADDPAIRAIVAEELSVVDQPLVDQLVADGHLRGATAIAVESWLAFVRTACVKWIDSQDISRDNITNMCLRVFDGALDVPMSSSRMRARLFGVVQSPAIGSLIRKSRSVAVARVPGTAISPDPTPLVASSTAFIRRRR